MSSRPPLRSSITESQGSYLIPGTSDRTQGRNPLTLKVNRLISANLEDAGTRAALDTLGEFESALSVEDGANRRANKANQAIGVALRRGGLRKEVEGRMAEGSREFLAAFSEVNDVSLVSLSGVLFRLGFEDEGLQVQGEIAPRGCCGTRSRRGGSLLTEDWGDSDMRGRTSRGAATSSSEVGSRRRWAAWRLCRSSATLRFDGVGLGRLHFAPRFHLRETIKQESHK